MANRVLLLTVYAFLGMLGMACAQAQATREGSEISRAEEMVFSQDHLKSLKAGSSLQYSFARRGSLEAALDDKAAVKIRKVGVSGREVEVQCLTGERKVELPLEGELKGNPIILCFLERDIREMKRITGGSMSYYRKRIRMALAQEAVIKTREVTLNGKLVSATEITLEPYSRDEARVRFAKYANKTYRFVLSDAVRGGVLELQSTMHEAGRPDVVMVEETLSYKKS